MSISYSQRSIIHFDLDTFFVSVERLLDSKLNNRPVLVGGVSDRGVVASCSYEARLWHTLRYGHENSPQALLEKSY